MLLSCFQRKVLLASRHNQILRAHSYATQLESKITELSKNVYKQRVISRRPLDGLESLFHECHKTGIGFSYLVTGIRSKVPIEEKSLREALTMVSYQQPLLRATITETADVKYFESKEGRVSFGFSALDKDINDTEAITEEIFANTKFERDNGPLWNAVLIPGNFHPSSETYTGGVALAISHAIANAHSLVAVLRQTLGYLENIAKGTAPKVEDIPSLPLYPSSAALLSHKLKNLSTPNRIISSQDYINPVLNQFPTIENDPQKSEPRTKVLIRTIPAERVVSFLQQCRSNNCSITGAILAACHYSFSALLKTTQFSANATNDITCLTSVGKNHQPTLPNDYVACHYGALTYDIELSTSNTDFWELARSLTKDIRYDIGREKHLEFLSKVETDSQMFIKNVLHEGSLKLASRKKSSLTVSNIGSVFTETNPEDLFHPQELIVGTPIHKRFGTFGNYIIGLKGKLHYMFCYDGSIISREIAQSYSDGVWNALKLQA
ncbi:uncharacterized protein LOC114535786 [Dendronephthya gigantea]|uniref:uncharacterized protein LOC114535786 n=1 Tax=Dendronephthya gigantea TaxID=151771 RepID=UPI00106A659D|nr:uncharacterized protein LOC114535786 [Dendronephthya gigantea]